jgi:murein DD-endopeptidase MepM/ murein hydrolase activator NlpD
VFLGLIVAGALLSYSVSQGFSFASETDAGITGLSLPGVAAAPAPDSSVLTSEALPNTVRREEVGAALTALAGGPSQEANVAAAVEAEAEPVALFTFYAVQEGDTASSIAAAFGIDLQYLLWANSDLRDGESLTVGQMLVVPAGNGILHTTRYGETLSDIAVRYGVSTEAILAWTGNGLASADQVLEDTMVFVPGGTAPVAVLPEATPAPEPVAVAAPPPAPPPPPPPPTVAPPPVPVSTGLIWPVGGPISSYMDGSHPLGIDIDLFNNPYAAIGAATSGTVTFAGGSTCCSYGLHVIVMSPGGVETLYAHLSSIAVSSGQAVGQGQILGNAGCTGYCTGNHLHFEVIDNGVRVNPLNYLP